MLNLFDPDYVVRQVYKLVAGADIPLKGETTADLRTAYRQFLIAKSMLPKAGSTGASSLFRPEESPDEPGDNPKGRVVLPLSEELAEQARGSFRAMSPGWAEIFDLLIHRIYLPPRLPARAADNALSGSSIDKLGSFWVMAYPHTTVDDVLEMYLHEVIHHMLFIDALNEPQFHYSAVLRKDNFGYTALDVRRAPLDRVMHSIVIALGIVFVRHAHTGAHGGSHCHPSTQLLLAQLQKSLQEVRYKDNLHELMTGPMIQRLEECWSALVQFCAEHSYDMRKA